MWVNRKGTWVAAWGLVLLAGLPALAQGLRDAQIFEPAEPSHYGGGVRANEGFFFVYDGLYWAMSPPQRATFGVDTSTLATQRNVWWGSADPNQTSTQGSTLDTSSLQTGFMMGQRIEVGQMYQHVGWLFGYFQIHWLSQIHGATGVQTFFNDEDWGVNNLPHLFGDSGVPGNAQNLGVQFNNATFIDAFRPWGTEFNLLFRTHPGEWGGMWEWFLGARFLQFNEQFDIHASGGILARTDISTYARNNLVGPQVGLRWFISNDRWQFSTLCKFFGAWNSQNVFEDGVLGTDLIGLSFPRGTNEPFALQTTNFSYSSHLNEFSPAVELRVEGKYQMTRSIAFVAGWNGMYIANLARPSEMIDYTLRRTSVMGILNDRNKDYLFMEGLSIGIEINR